MYRNCCTEPKTHHSHFHACQATQMYKFSRRHRQRKGSARLLFCSIYFGSDRKIWLLPRDFKQILSASTAPLLQSGNFQFYFWWGLKPVKLTKRIVDILIECISKLHRPWSREWRWVTGTGRLLAAAESNCRIGALSASLGVLGAALGTDQWLC